MGKIEMGGRRMEGGMLIHHQHVAAKPSRPTVMIGPKSKSTTPLIKLNKNGDTIESIEIQCACGETIVVQCEYEEPSSA